MQVGNDVRRLGRLFALVSHLLFPWGNTCSGCIPRLKWHDLREGLQVIIGVSQSQHVKSITTRTCDRMGCEVRKHDSQDPKEDGGMESRGLISQSAL